MELITCEPDKINHDTDEEFKLPGNGIEFSVKGKTAQHPLLIKTTNWMLKTSNVYINQWLQC